MPPNSPAARTGLKPVDVITKIGDQVITDSNALSAAIHSAAPHSTLTLTYTTDAAPHTVPGHSRQPPRALKSSDQVDGSEL